MQRRSALIASAAVIVGLISVGVAGATTAFTRPTGLTATPTSVSAITLHWTDTTSTERGFDIQRSLANKTSFKTITTTPANASSYPDNGLTAATAYKYRIRALKTPTGASSYSTIVTATTLGGTPTDTTKPSVPAGLTRTVASCSQINLTWTASTDNAGGSGVGTYNLYRNGTLVKSITAPATSASDTGLGASTNYSYAITAVDNANNESARSASVSTATPACPNTIVPVPHGFTAAGTSCAFVVATWNPIYDPNNTFHIAKYNLYRNGVLAQTVTSPNASAVDNGRAALTTYSYAVAAVDASNHESAKTTAVTTTTPACPAAGAWAKTIGGAGAESSTTVAVDSAGNVVIGGTFNTSGDFGDGPVAASAGGDLFIAKYSAANQLLWKKTFANTSTSPDYLYSIATDAAGNVFAAGSFVNSINLGGGNLSNTGTASDAFVAKFSAAGAYQWAKTWGNAPYDDAATGVAVDSHGNPVFSGWFVGTNVDFGGPKLSGTNGRYNSFVVNLSSVNGATTLAFATPCGAVNAYGLALDAADNVVLTGRLGSSCDFGGGRLSQTDYDAFVVKYTATGSFVWARSFGSGGLVPDWGNAVAIDPNGDVIVTGVFTETVDFGTGPIGGRTNAGQAFVVKLRAADGTTAWAKGYGNLYGAFGNGVAADAQGNVTVTGEFSGTIDFGGGDRTGPTVNNYPVQQAFVVELSASGAHIASDRYGDTSNTVGYDVASSATGAVVTGRFSGRIDLGFGPVTTNGPSYDSFLLNTGR